jgi:hypothetical protein
VQVHYDEGVATHIGPEPCIVVRENGGEASAGESIGQVLSLENYVLPERGRVTHRGRQYGRARHRKAWTVRRGQRPWHVRKLLEREPGDPTTDHRQSAVLVRIGKARSRSR